MNNAITFRRNRATMAYCEQHACIVLTIIRLRTIREHVEGYQGAALDGVILKMEASQDEVKRLLDGVPFDTQLEFELLPAAA